MTAVTDSSADDSKKHLGKMKTCNKNTGVKKLKATKNPVEKVKNNKNTQVKS